MTEKPKKTVTHIRPEKSERIFSVSEIWKFRPLLKQLISRNNQTRIFNSPITLLWGFIRPAIMTLAFFYIRRMANADFGSGVPYVLFIFSGLCLWFLFAEVTVQVAGSISTDASLSRKVYFPRILSPISVVLGRWIDCIVILAAIVVFQLFIGISISASFPFIILVMATLLLLAFGSGLIFAALVAVHKDYRKILETVLYLGLFLSPVLFSKSILPLIIQKYYIANPMVGVLSGMRGALFAPASIDMNAWLASVAISLGLTILGLGMLSWAIHNHGDKI